MFDASLVIYINSTNIPVRKADNLPPSCADVKKSGGLNLLEPCGPVQACNGTSLPFSNIPQFMIINRIYETKSSVAVACFLPGRAKDLSGWPQKLKQIDIINTNIYVEPEINARV